MNPLLQPLSIFIVALSMSIGWGIRGNYGHETGAMFPGALAAVAVCVLSNRADWQRRVIYFALFGMIGWAFGGSISYMMVIGYTQSGHSASQLYGFFGLFLIGFLWAALGGGATALPAVLDSTRLAELFRPLVILLATWSVLYFALDPISAAVQRAFEISGVAGADQRHERMLYWLDSDWMEVGIVLMVLLACLSWNRRAERIYRLPIFAAVAAAMAFLVALVIHKTVGLSWIGRVLVQHQGVHGDRFSVDQLAVANWPRVILHLASSSRWFFPGDGLALLLGAIVGAAIYFAIYVRLSFGFALPVYMAVGWFVGFLTLPVIGSLFLSRIGGLRMTPPRGDNWAGILGAYVGAAIFCLRYDLRSVLRTSIICGAIGGAGFAGTACLEAILVSFGNRNVSDEPSVQDLWTEWQATEWSPALWGSAERMPAPAIADDLPVDDAWRHWQSQNWHSFLEQSYGFVNGIGLTIAMGLLALNSPRLSGEPVERSWQKIVAAIFAIPVLIYVNMVKNLDGWMSDAIRLPDSMSMPFVKFQLSTTMWFNLFCLLAAIAFVGLLLWNRIRPLAVIPSVPVGRGQFVFLILLWAFAFGNLARSLAGFTENRLLTEGIITLNAILVTVLILTVARSDEDLMVPETRIERPLAPAIAFCLLLLVAVPFVSWKSVRHIYGDAHTGKRGMDFRFGPNANWKRLPLLNGETHR